MSLDAGLHPSEDGKKAYSDSHFSKTGSISNASTYLKRKPTKWQSTFVKIARLAPVESPRVSV